jgi:FMN-dependent NADH-azoreductase
MTSLLHLDSSANRSGESVSRELTSLFARTWQAAHSGSTYRYRDLAAAPIPPLDTAYCELGRRVERHGLIEPETLIESEAERRAWELTRPLVAEVLAADTLLIGAPMYNYSVSAALKAWIDRVSFPGVFADGQLRDTRVMVVTSRGGTYRPGSPDFLRPYLRAYLGKQGIAGENIRFVSAELTLADLVPHLAKHRDAAADSLAAARAEIVTLALGRASTLLSEPLSAASEPLSPASNR